MTDASVFRTTDNKVLTWNFNLKCTQGGIYGECEVSDTTDYKKDKGLTRSVVAKELEKLIYK